MRMCVGTSVLLQLISAIKPAKQDHLFAYLCKSGAVCVNNSTVFTTRGEGKGTSNVLAILPVGERWD